MSAKTFCPIMTIGFNPPEQGQRDLRLCMKDCAWYDVTDNRCSIIKISQMLENIESHANDISDYLGDMMTFGGFPNEEVERPYDEEEYFRQRNYRLP